MADRQLAPGGGDSGSGTEYTDEEYTDDDLIDRILENYTTRLEPELRFKLRHRLQDMVLTACYSKPWQIEPRWRFTMKPTSSTGPISKYVRSLLVVPALSSAAIYSNKINFSVFRLQFVLGFNYAKRTPSLDYRLTTKWGDGPRLKRKEKVQVSDSCELRCKWNLEAQLPDMEGHIGGSSAARKAVDVDYGSVHFEVSQLDFVLDM